MRNSFLFYYKINKCFKTIDLLLQKVQFFFIVHDLTLYKIKREKDDNNRISTPKNYCKSMLMTIKYITLGRMQDLHQ